MRFFLSVIGCALACLLPGARANQLDDAWTFENGVLRSCDAIPAEATFSGTLTVLRSIECETPSSIDIVGNTIIRSHAGINFTDLAVNVHEGAHLVFIAPTVTLARSDMMQGKGVPILWVDGTVEFNVESWLESHLEGSLVDEHGIISFGSHGSIRSTAAAVHYTGDAIIAADPAKADKVNDFDAAGSKFPQDAHLREDLAARHAASLRSNSVTESTNPALPISSNLDEAGAPSSPDLAPDSVSSAMMIAMMAVQNYDSTKGTPAADAADAAERFANGGGGGNVPHAQDSTSAPVSEDKTGGSVQSTGDSDRSSSPPPRHTSWAKKQHSQNKSSSRFNESNNNTNNNSKQRVDGSSRSGGSDGSGGSSSSGGGSGSDNSSVPPGMKAHPGRSLKVGDKLTGKLLSPNRKSMLYPSPLDGSVMFTKVTGKAPRDADGKKTGPSPQTTATVFAPDSKKMARARQIRADVIDEEKGTGKEGHFKAMMRWMPFGKAGWRETRARKHCKAHFGESAISITNRGVVEASIDGRVVAKRSARSWFGLRRKDSSYEVWATDTGLAVTRGGKHHWSLAAEDIIGY